MSLRLQALVFAQLNCEFDSSSSRTYIHDRKKYTFHLLFQDPRHTGTVEKGDQLSTGEHGKSYEARRSVRDIHREDADQLGA